MKTSLVKTAASDSEMTPVSIPGELGQRPKTLDKAGGPCEAAVISETLEAPPPQQRNLSTYQQTEKT